MVKDHQSLAFDRNVDRLVSDESAPPTWPRWRFRFSTPGGSSQVIVQRHQTPAQTRHGTGSAKKLWLVGLLLLGCGCQSGLVDSGRSRRSARPSPTLSAPSTSGQSPVLEGPVIPPGPTSRSGSSSAPISLGPPEASLNWNHVNRQSAATAVQMPALDEAKANYHTVQANETWSSLARLHGLTVKQLADANGIDAATLLKPGQIVYIPK